MTQSGVHGLSLSLEARSGTPFKVGLVVTSGESTDGF